MTTTLTKVALPTDLVQELDAVASNLGISREEMARSILERQLADLRKWQELRETFGELARKAGIENEDDVEAFIDSLDD